jgi:two-component system, OmpR family, response regulator
MRNIVVNYLEDHDMRAMGTPGRQQVMSLLTNDVPRLVILDLNLGSGFDLLRKIRSRSNVPIIITIGDRGDEIDPVAGLELGADDYVNKSFGFRELLARVRAVLRRDAGRLPPPRDRCLFGGWQFDRNSRRLTAPDGSPVRLTRGEYALLIAFLDAPQRPLAREHLLQATRTQEDAFDRSINVRVLRLRRKIEADPRAPRIIQTKRGFGYVFALPVEQT